MRVLSFTDKRTTSATPIFLRVMIIVQVVLVVGASCNLLMLRLVHSESISYSTVASMLYGLPIWFAVLRGSGT